MEENIAVSEKKARMLAILEETIAFYGADPSRRAVAKPMQVDKPAVKEFVAACRYRTEDGRQCALGRCMEPAAYEERFEGRGAAGINILLDHEGLSLDSILQPKYRGLSTTFWNMLQVFHDEGGYWTETGISLTGTRYLEEIRELIEHDEEHSTRLF